MPSGIILEPNYAALRARFGTEARFQADTILADLLPESLIEPEHVKRIQAQVLRAMQSVLAPINICIQAIDSKAAVVECRELVDAVSKTVIAKADEIDRAIHRGGDDLCRTCGRRGLKVFQMEDGYPMCVECAADGKE